jgi:2-polyprenyl-3-methyl-5-hydroxy-6-metoxy-1,4-benzoquinol methylase
MEKNIYIKKPIKIRNEIPVFSEINDYIENYEKISSDHMDAFKKTGKNPFMEEAYWKATEDSTRVFIDKYSKPGFKILDVGVGMGRLLEDYKQLDRYGMDISKTYLEITKEKGINCCISLIEDMPYNDNMFDIITCTDVLEHVLDLYQGVENTLRVLKPGGILIVRVPYKEDLSWYLSEKCPYEYVHVRSFDEDNLKALFTKIFKTKILDWNTAGEWIADPRLKHPIFPYNKYIGRLIKMYYNRVQKKDIVKYKSFFNDCSINVVVQKPLDVNA